MTIYCVNKDIYFKSKNKAEETALSLWEEDTYEEFLWCIHVYKYSIEAALKEAIEQEKARAKMKHSFYEINKITVF